MAKATRNLNSLEVAASQGEGAYINHEPPEANPYPKGSELAIAWNQGYEELASRDLHS